MSASANELSSGLLADYRTHPDRGAFDELTDEAGPRAHTRTLAGTIVSMGLGGLLAARSEAAALVADEGITIGTPISGLRRPWLVDPLPLTLSREDWSQLEVGLQQRAVLLDLVLTDLYSERRLLRGLIPPAAILAHPGFTRQTDQIRSTNRRQLLLTATDLGRDATGTWRVISDRTAEPAGAGYAMATRRIVSQVLAGLHRASDLARLRGFFHTMTGALLDSAPGGSENPRVVLLSPGSAGGSTYDLGFLAAMLGFALAEADDLLMSRGQVWLRAGDELEPVEVILRRVDALASDPLELRGDSENGLPGMIEGTRQGLVGVANPVGAGVLDNPALIAYLEPVSRALLGEDPLLDSPTTWWCGDRAGLSHVLTNLERLVIKPIARPTGPSGRYGWLMSSTERDLLARQILAEPWAWCGQEALELSTAPVVTSSGLEPRRFVLRTFGVASGERYQFLPGGLGRVAASTKEQSISSTVGSLAKDVWVPAAATERTRPERDRPRLQLARVAAVPPRVARALMRIGKYAERTENTARLVKVADDLVEDFSSRSDTSGAAAAAQLVQAVGRITDIQQGPAESAPDFLARVALDPSAVGGVHYCARRLSIDAQEVRDVLSGDTWSVLSRLEVTLNPDRSSASALQPLLAEVLESSLAFAGIMAQSMVRDSSWAFLDAGSRLERARHTVSLLRNLMLDQTDEPTADLAADAVLRAGESIITHRRRAASGQGPSTTSESVRQLLVHDPSNPRSVSFQLAALAADLRLVADERLAHKAEAILADVDAYAAAAPDDAPAVLDQLDAALAGMVERIGARHFARQARRRTAESWSGARAVRQ